MQSWVCALCSSQIHPKMQQYAEIVSKEKKLEKFLVKVDSFFPVVLHDVRSEPYKSKSLRSAGLPGNRPPLKSAHS